MFNVKLLQNYCKSSLPTVRKQTTNLACPLKIMHFRKSLVPFFFSGKLLYCPIDSFPPNTFFLTALFSWLPKQTIMAFFKAIYLSCFLKPLQFENAYRKVLGIHSPLYLTVAFSNITSIYPVIDLHVLKFLLKSMETSTGKKNNQRQETAF